jgi:ATP-dependent DNA helicase PIF1
MTFYAVAKGRIPGVYNEWSAAKEQVDGFSGASFKLFKTEEEAVTFVQEAKPNATVEANPAAVSTPIEEHVIPSRLDTLTGEQRAVFDALLEGKSIALLGPAGVGKSYLLSIIYTELAQMRLCNVQLCAMTGCAALLLGHKAKTLHSWAGIGLGKDDVPTLYSKIVRNGRAKKNWKITDVLVIDEISMSTPDLLDKLDQLGKMLRKSDKLFGGIQILLVGDFYQLPPVSRNGSTALFAFESNLWKQLDHVMELTIIQRQKDPVFQRILMEARTGSFTRESCDILETCTKKEWRTNRIRPTLIFPKRAEVDKINEANLLALVEEPVIYHARITLNKEKTPPGFKEKSEAFQTAVNILDGDAPYHLDIELRIGAQVMLIANLDFTIGLVNGSRGIITRICPVTKLPVVEFINGIERTIGYHDWAIDGFPFASRSQLPLRLSYAITIHRSQGATLDCALIDVGMGTFEYGQAYVALSRVTSLDALYIYDFDPRAFRVHPKVHEYYLTRIRHVKE